MENRTYHLEVPNVPQRVLEQKELATEQAKDRIEKAHDDADKLWPRTVFIAAVASDCFLALSRQAEENGKRLFTRDEIIQLIGPMLQLITK